MPISSPYPLSPEIISHFLSTMPHQYISDPHNYRCSTLDLYFLLFVLLQWPQIWSFHFHSWSCSKPPYIMMEDTLSKMQIWSLSLCLIDPVSSCPSKLLLLVIQPICYISTSEQYCWFILLFVVCSHLNLCLIYPPIPVLPDYAYTFLQTQFRLNIFQNTLPDSLPQSLSLFLPMGPGVCACPSVQLLILLIYLLHWTMNSQRIELAFLFPYL